MWEKDAEAVTSKEKRLDDNMFPVCKPEQEQHYVSLLRCAALLHCTMAPKKESIGTTTRPMTKRQQRSEQCLVDGG